MNKEEIEKLNSRISQAEIDMHYHKQMTRYFQEVILTLERRKKEMEQYEASTIN